MGATGETHAVRRGRGHGSPTLRWGRWLWSGCGGRCRSRTSLAMSPRPSRPSRSTTASWLRASPSARSLRTSSTPGAGPQGCFRLIGWPGVALQALSLVGACSRTTSGVLSLSKGDVLSLALSEACPEPGRRVEGVVEGSKGCAAGVQLRRIEEAADESRRLARFPQAPCFNRGRLAAGRVWSPTVLTNSQGSDHPVL